MTSTDNDRRILHAAVEQMCGPRPAEILMEHLPPAGWRDLATRNDVESASLLLRTDMEIEFEKVRAEFADVRAEMRAEFADVRAEMRTEFSNIRTEMRTEFSNIRTEMRTEFSNIRAEMAAMRAELIAYIEKGFRSQTWKLVGALIASQSATIGALALMVR